MRLLNIYLLLIFTTGLLIFPMNMNAQKINIISSSPIDFGKFFKTNGGEIKIDPINGSIVPLSGDIIIVTNGIRGEIVVKPSNINSFSNKKVNVSIVQNPNVTLNTIPILIDVYPQSFQFDTSSLDPKQTVYLGGTLSVGGPVHPKGIYNGSFTVQFDVVNQ